MTITTSSEPLDDTLIAVSSHVLAMRMTLRDMQASYDVDPTSISVADVLDACAVRTSHLGDAVADASSCLRDTHSLDPVTTVTSDAQNTAVSLVTAFLLDQERDADNQLLSTLLEELFTSPDSSYRHFAAVIAAMTRLGALLASCGDELAPQEAMSHLRECLSLVR